MKKAIIFFNFFLLFLFIDTYYVSLGKEHLLKEEQEIRFIYISYLEYLNNFQGNSMTINKSKIDKMIDNVTYNKFNAIFLQVSPFSDAIYNSKYFPYSYTLTGQEGKNPGFDYLDYFIKKAHSKNIKIHAWINPYRISLQNDIDVLCTTNPALSYINTENIGISNRGIYYDPTSENVKELIEKQVLEIINNYNVDGIHLDDYFYVDVNIDSSEYQTYLSNGGKLSLKEYRLMHTNDLVKRISDLIKKRKSSIIFSISPDGNINNNYKYHYADIKTWISNGYIDIIMPQLYYGFENQYLPFEKAYAEWEKLVKASSYSVKLLPVLAFYKIGVLDTDAGSGKKEWLQNGIIEKQINYLKQKEIYEGFGLFRYDFLFNEEISNELSKESLINVRNL